MTNSVNLFLASGVSKGIGFWLVNFTDEEDIFIYQPNKLLECYRKELFGLEAAIEVKEAINTTLDILAMHSKLDLYKLDNSNNICLLDGELLSEAVSELKTTFWWRDPDKTPCRFFWEK